MEKQEIPFLKKKIEHFIEITNTAKALENYMAVCLIIELLSVKSPANIKLSRDSKK